MLTIAEAMPPRPSLEAGTVIGRYTIDRLLGSGGMGEVYAAHDPELGREVAIKISRDLEGSSLRARARFLREAQAMALLSHPNVVTVYDVGTYGDRIFVAMERLSGISLAEWLATPRTWRDVLDVLLAAGRGLAAAHAAGIVHRDFKPHNVMV